MSKVAATGGLEDSARQGAARRAGRDVAGVFSADELDALHRMAHALYTQGLYNDAARYFWLLSLHVPKDTRYLAGMAASLFMAKRFAEAVIAYSVWVRLAPKDPEALCLCGHALLMRGELKDARACLEFASQLPGKPEFSGRARALLELMGR
jgi:Flp pilus assembly protein TadD